MADIEPLHDIKVMDKESVKEQSRRHRDRHLAIDIYDWRIEGQLKGFYR